MATWKDISIEKFEKIARLQEQNMTEIDMIAAVLSVIDDTTVEEVEKLPYAVLLLKARGLRFLNTNPIPSIVKKSYVYDNVKYVPTLNPQKLTTAQYIDFQTTAAESPNDLAGLISILLIPEGHKYNEGYCAEELRDVIYKNMPIEDAMGLSAFFFTLWKISIRRLLRENRRLYRKLKRKKQATEEEIKLTEVIKNLIEAIEQVLKYS